MQKFVGNTLRFYNLIIIFRFGNFMLDTILRLIHTVTYEQTQTWQTATECQRAQGD